MCQAAYAKIIKLEITKLKTNVIFEIQRSTKNHKHEKIQKIDFAYNKQYNLVPFLNVAKF